MRWIVKVVNKLKVPGVLLIAAFLLASCPFGSFGRVLVQGAHPDTRANGIAEIAAPEVDDPNDYTFCVFTDMHVNKDGSFGSFGIYDPDLPGRLVSCCVEKGVEFVVNMGDFAEYGREMDYDTYEGVLKLFRDNGIPNVYTCVGNHDLYNNGWELYKERISPCPASSSPSVFMFTIGNHSYYCLDSASGTFGTNQYLKVKEKFSGDSNVKTVFSHYTITDKTITGAHDLISSEAECAAFKELFSTNNVDYFFNGHVHTHLETKFENFIHYNVSCAYAKGDKPAEALIVNVKNGVIESIEVINP